MTTEPTGLSLYDQTAQEAAAVVIAGYSTSFGLASKLLGPRVRHHVRNIYALVRIADEVVDGPAADAGLAAPALRVIIDELEAETLAAIRRGFSSNLVVHAFAQTARECRIDRDLIAPFFASMRADITTMSHDAQSHDDYVYGSAEVVGLMCLRAFQHARPAPGDVGDDEVLVDGARRLGRAFQDVNFLRDLDHDAGALGRDYLGIETGLTTRSDVLDRIDADLAAAAAAVPGLPADCRRAVTAAHDLFAELSRRLREQEPSNTARVRVPDPVKARLAARAWLGMAPKGPRA